MLKKSDYMKIIKISAGAGLAIILAEALGLRYAASAGVITLLSIQDTKKETLRVVARRLFSFGMALFLAFFCFRLLGYNAVAVVVFLLLFSAACMALRMQEGISVNTVLMLHFLADQSMTLADAGNELALLLVGAGIGVVLNLYIPGKQKEIREQKQRIETCIKEILGHMAGVLLGEKPVQASANESLALASADESLVLASENLGRLLEQGEKSAYEDMENRLLTETRYYIRYMNMRKIQSMILSRIAEHLGHLGELPPQAEAIAGLMEQIAGHFHEYNNAVGLLEELDRVKLAMREQPLPAARAEFENRAVLFGILLEVEQFLLVKKEFVEELTEDEIRRFWKKEETE